MAEYLQNMILAYFKRHDTCSIINLSKLFGIPVATTMELIEKLIVLEKIAIEDGKIILTQKGRLELQNQVADFCFFNDYRELPKVNFEERWDINKAYVPNNFMKKLR